MFFANINRTQAAEIDLDLQTRPSERPNVFRVNLSQICSVVPEIPVENHVFCPW